ncbi:hypothetical protein PJP14_29230 [Mycobacterium kansasii]
MWWDTSLRVTTFKPTQSKEMRGIYVLKEEDDINARIPKLTRKVEAMELKKGSTRNGCGSCLWYLCL